MVLDIAKYGVEETGVAFTLMTPPTYGTLALDLLLTSRSDHSFTLQDINQDKVIDRLINLFKYIINVSSELAARSTGVMITAVLARRLHTTITIEINEDVAGTRVRSETRSACT